MMATPAEPSQPLTPPAESSSHPPPTAPAAGATSAAGNVTQAQSQLTTNGAKPSSRVEALLSKPLTSLNDDGKSKRPRDHRLIHLLLAAYGISAYQERVPLQLMDFAYRYTNGVLSDALHVQLEGYDQAEGGTTTGGSKARGGNKGHNASHKNNEDGDINLASLRTAIQSRSGYQMTGSLPKEFLKQLADEKNRISLTAGARDSDRAGAMVGGLRLPHERHCLTGSGWGLKDEWESEGEESVEEDDVTGGGRVNEKMQLDGPEDQDEDEEGGRMEDIFGDDTGAAGGDGDAEMEDT